MFDLKQSIKNWRSQMLAAGIKTPVPLEELESHLHEEIGQLLKLGLDEEKAFHTAVRKIGPGQAIRNEFEKVGGARRGRILMLYEILFMGATLFAPLFVGGVAFIVNNGRFSEMTFNQKMASVGAAATFSLFALGMRLICGKFPVVHTKRIRDVIFVPVVVWLLALAYVIMPRCDFSEAQKGVVSLWGFAPCGILVGWSWGFANASRKNVATIVS